MITSSIEAELLILFQIIREIMHIMKLFGIMKLQMKQPLIIQCDNRQIIRLIEKEDLKLNIRLRHVDIHNHWLKQQHQREQLILNWVSTVKMSTDDLTKTLFKQKHEDFVRMIDLIDISDKLAMEQRAAKEKKKSINQKNQLIFADAKVKISRLLKK